MPEKPKKKGDATPASSGVGSAPGTPGGPTPRTGPPQGQGPGGTTPGAGAATQASRKHGDVPDVEEREEKGDVLMRGGGRVRETE